MKGVVAITAMPNGTRVPIPVESKVSGAAASSQRAYVLLAGCWLLLAAAHSPLTATAAPATATAGPAHAKPGRAQVALFTHITSEQRLSDQGVLSVMQDRAGFMWFGTKNGLDRYDGYTIVEYRNDPTNPHSLSGNYIEVLYLDRSGTLWVGTVSGLNAFDPRTEQFTRYQHDPADPHSLSDSTVFAITEDRNGVLWVGTQGGLNRFDRATRTFTSYRHDPANRRSLSHDTVRAIAEDRNGVLWVGTLGGLNRFDRAGQTFTAYRHDPTNPRSLSYDSVWDVRQDRAGALWVGTDGGGLNRFNPITRGFTHYRHDPGNPHGLGSDRIDCISEDGSGALWIGTFGGGLSVLDAARRSFTTYRHDPTLPESLSHDYIADITRDRSGLTWLATQASGVDVCSPQSQAFTLYRHEPGSANSLASDDFAAEYEDRDGVLWIGTRDRGLDRFDRRRGMVDHYPPDPGNPQRLGHPFVSAIQQDRTGALWVGTYGGGLYRRDPASGIFTAYRHDPANPRSLSSNDVYDLLMDRSGDLWIATLGGGLNRFDRASGTFTVYRHAPDNPLSLSSDVIWALEEDRYGGIWSGTIGGGLSRLEPATGRMTRYRNNPQDPASLGNDNVAALHVDRSGILWVGTLGGGLDRFDPSTAVRADRPTGAFTHYRERDGLASDRIVSILEDGHAGDPVPGNLWIATGGGLSRLDRDRKRFQNFNAIDGLPVMVFNRGGCKTRGGELLLSGSDGLLAFDPDKVLNDASVPPVVFTNFLLANKPEPIAPNSRLHQAIDQTRSLTLSYADRVISFEFAALNFRSPLQARYRYKLENFDPGWIEAGNTQRLVTYTNLDPGRYVFRVTVANANGVWNPTGRAITLVITPPWWETWWFRGIALALFIGGAWGLYTGRVNSLRRQQRALEAEIVERKQVEEELRASHRQIQDLAGRLINAQEEERTRIARELHDDVNQRLAALSIAHSSLMRRLPPEASEARSELAGLQQQTITLCNEIRSLSHELHPGVLQHAGLLAALRGHCAEFGHQHGIAVTFDPTGDLDGIPPETALCLYRVVQEALHNVVTHAQARQVTVALARTSDGLALSVADDGRGFDPVSARRDGGLGLTSIEERARLLGGTVQISTQRQRGTDLRVQVPLRALPQRKAKRNPSASGARR
jgi:signal transduction histidine kinase/ligand-binding sensor domain-containing protein